MKHENRSLELAIAVIMIVVAFAALPAMAQQITGTPGCASSEGWRVQQEKVLPG